MLSGNENIKSGSHFHFKQFSIAHDRCTHKVGTDGVLLGAWVNVEKVNTILEIGTGSGVVAIMLAQRTAAETKIDAIEIEKDDAQQAMDNVQHSPWKEKVRIHLCAAQDFYPNKQYDLIVSNPPYFINSQHPPKQKRKQARHTESLSFAELLDTVIRLLKDDGKFAVILPFREGLQFITLAQEYKLYCNKQIAFKTRAHKPVERWLLEFSYQKVINQQNELLLYHHSNEWSEQYKNLTREFYINI